MQPATSPNPQRGWSAPQRMVLTVIVGGLLIYAIALAALNRAHIPDPQPPEGERAHMLDTQVDPNTATLHELATLPNIGETRAGEIIAYRERVKARDPGATAFTDPDDLLRVKGIGWALRDHLRPHLRFPTTAPAAADGQ